MYIITTENGKKYINYKAVISNDGRKTKAVKKRLFIAKNGPFSGCLYFNNNGHRFYPDNDYIREV